MYSVNRGTENNYELIGYVYETFRYICRVRYLIVMREMMIFISNHEISLISRLRSVGSCLNRLYMNILKWERDGITKREVRCFKRV